jgi:lipid-A-disaccharide synthase
MQQKTLSVFVIAGEQSGDMLGARVILELKKQLLPLNTQLKLYGLGGEELEHLGLQSIFDYKQLSIMGFVDVVKKIFRLKKLINQTAKAIANIKPDMVISIDSGGFCFRVVSYARRLLGKEVKNTKFYHYVAPAVWAYHETRGLRLKKLYDRIFCLYDFEPQYFTRYGLDAICVGTDFTYFNANTKSNDLSKSTAKPRLAITLGSRLSEVKAHAVIIKDVIEKGNLEQDYDILFLATASTLQFVSLQFSGFKVVCGKNAKLEVLQTADFAIAKSGTNAMEFLANKVKCLVLLSPNSPKFFLQA